MAGWLPAAKILLQLPEAVSSSTVIGHQQLPHHFNLFKASLEILHLSIAVQQGSSSACSILDKHQQPRFSQPGKSQQQLCLPVQLLPPLQQNSGIAAAAWHCHPQAATQQQPITGQCKPYSTWPQQQQYQQHKQQHQQQQRRGSGSRPYPSSPWKHIQHPAVAPLAIQAFNPSFTQQQRAASLQAAFTAMLQQQQQQQQQAVGSADIVALLHCFEHAGVAVPLPAMRQLLQHMDANAHLFDCGSILRVFRSASFAQLTTNSSSSDGGSNGSSGVGARRAQQVSVNRLVARLWKLTEAAAAAAAAAAGSPGTPAAQALAPGSVPQLLRCLSVLQQRPPAHLVNNLVQYWLDSCCTQTASTGHGSSTTSSTSSSSSSSSGKGQTMTAQEGIILKAVHGMNMTLPGAMLQQLLLPLLEDLHGSTGGGSSGSSSSSRVSPAAAVAAAAQLPPLLLAAHQLDRDNALSQQQRAQLLAAASRTLQALAAAAGLVSSSSSSGRNQLSDSPASSAASIAQPSHDALCRSIVTLTKTLRHIQRASPLSQVHGLVDSLAYELLEAEQPARYLSAYLSSLAGLNLAPSLDCMADITGAVCSQYRQEQQWQQQQQQQQQQRPQPDGSVAAQFLFASASLGYSLHPADLQVGVLGTYVKVIWYS
jgi:hypothetical protein